jgi:hypothetical protein
VRTGVSGCKGESQRLILSFPTSHSVSLDQPVTGSSPVHLVVVTNSGHNRHDSNSAALVFLRPIQHLARAAMMKNAQAGNYWPWRCEERTGKLMLLAPARFMTFSPSPRRENRSCCDTRFALTGTADRSNHSMTISHSSRPSDPFSRVPGNQRWMCGQCRDAGQWIIST